MSEIKVIKHVTVFGNLMFISIDFYDFISPFPSLVLNSTEKTYQTMRQCSKFLNISNFVKNWFVCASCFQLFSLRWFSKCGQIRTFVYNISRTHSKLLMGYFLEHQSKPLNSWYIPSTYSYYLYIFVSWCCRRQNFQYFWKFPHCR